MAPTTPKRFIDGTVVMEAAATIVVTPEVIAGMADVSEGAMAGAMEAVMEVATAAIMAVTPAAAVTAEP